MSFGKSKNKSSSKPLTPDEVAGYYGKLDELSGGSLADFAAGGTQPTQYHGVDQAAMVTAPKVNSYGVASREIAAPSLVGTQGIVSRDVRYKPVGIDQVKALGGLGSTRQAAIERERQKAREEVQANPAMTLYQQVRANQMTDDDLRTRMDAINQETEAAIAAMLHDQAARDLEAQTTNASHSLRASEGNAANVLRASEANAGNQLRTNETNASNALTADMFTARGQQDADTTNASNSIQAQTTNLSFQQEEALRRYLANSANNRLPREDLEALAGIFFGGKGSVSSGKGSSFNVGWESS